MDENKYYVYEWIRLDINEPFYVGKGCGDRWKDLTRGNNNHFNNIVKSIPIAVNILHDNLTEQMAYDLEVWDIREYRDIIGYDMCNINDGGDGQSLCGEANGLYGKKHTKEAKQKIGEKSKKRSQGENNPFYGKHHSEETKEKMRGRKKSQEEIEKIRKGVVGKQYFYENNPNSKKIICLNTLKIYDCIKLAIEEFNTETIYNVVNDNCCQKSIMYNNEHYYFMYYDEYLNSSEEDIKNKITPKFNSRKVICLNNLDIQPSIKSANEKYKLTSIKDCCRGRTKSCGKINGEKLVWMYYDEYLLLSEDEVKDKIKIANKKLK